MPGRSTNRDPLKKFRYRIQIEGMGKGGFKTSTLPKAKTAVSEYNEGTDATHPRLSPGKTKYDPVVMTRGQFVSDEPDSNALFNWYQQTHHAAAGGANDDPVFRRSVTIEVLGRSGQVAKRFELQNAWISEYDPGDLDAGSDDDLIESVTIVYEGFTMPGATEAPAVGASNAQALGVSEG